MFVVCGEALMDVFAEADTPTGMALDARVGGSPFNAAVGLARLAQPVSFFGAVSRGFLGERLMRALADEGVSTAATVRVDAPTTLGLVGTDAQGVPSYSFYGDGAADRQLGPEALALLPAATRAIHVGSYSTVVEPIASTLRRLIEREHTRTLISCDPNIRLNVEPELARWRAMLEWMLPRTHLLKISDEDLSLLWPGKGIEQFAQEVLAQGVRLLVVTRGGDGAQAWNAAAAVSVPAVPVAVADTVGAGDSFQSALLTRLAEHGLLAIETLGRISAAQLREALAFATQAAAITCSRRGANPPRRHELPA
ncbi:carbohydrate kinase family protein [Sphaerotilaceae bacterium SBD11-9]